MIVDRETMVGIITDKDIFRAITNNQTLIASLGSIEPLAEQREHMINLRSIGLEIFFISRKYNCTYQAILGTLNSLRYFLVLTR